MAETTGNMDIYPKLDNAIQFRLEINIIKDYFIVQICKRETMSKTLSKYVAALIILITLFWFYQQQMAVFPLLCLLLSLLH